MISPRIHATSAQILTTTRMSRASNACSSQIKKEAMDRDWARLRECMAIASSNDPVAGSRVAAIIIKKKEIDSIGFNQLKSHPFHRKHSGTDSKMFLHAETHAI